jgi:L-aminopeptidase/D-esterase-like protein
MVEKAQAVLLSGGSAFGLDAAAGVVRWLEGRGYGFPVPGGAVPIVPAAVLFDLSVGSFHARPGPEAGYAACEGAGPGVSASALDGSLGAGSGCTVGKRFGLARAMRGGQGTASLRVDLGLEGVGPEGVTVGALLAVNAVGDVYEPHTGALIAGARLPDGSLAGIAAWRHLPAGAPPSDPPLAPHPDSPSHLNTTIGVVATDAPLSPEQAQRVAWMAQDGLARAVRPAHTPLDGDTLFVLATGSAPFSVTSVALSAIGDAAAEVVARAIVRAVRTATPLPDLPAASGAT